VRRWLAGGAVLIVAVAALILALQGSLSHTSSHDVAHAPVKPHGAGRSATHTTTTATTASATTPTSPTLTPAPSSPSAADQKLHKGLAAQLAAVHAEGGSAGVLVFDLSTGKELFGVDAGVKRAPASVEKLWTTTALMDRLGPSATLQTSVLGTGTERHHVWHGNLYLRGGGDPTFGDAEFNQVWNGGQGTTPGQLAAKLRRMGIRRVTGKVYADESLFDRRRGGLMTAYKPDVPDYGGYLSALDYDHGTTAPHYKNPATFADHAFVLALDSDGIRATASRRDRTTPRRATLLATVSSPPMSVMIRLMDVPSDDLFADLFAKQLGVLFGHGGTISAGAHVISTTIASHYRLHPTILDGSGLSRDDRSSPLEIIDLLRDLWGTRTGSEVSAALPTVGVNGTVEGIGAGTAAQGRCIAKTGSLDDVTNLAGYCHGRHGQQLAFGLFIDGPDNATGFALESRMIAAIARY
jgi:D-alanyl-D-alanine carboxypeptidase/D-alanyl-D-alanine-endopeptidase (penicillin-binding protein 4)